jgi:peroxiredoxin (alkyl hydroperoxide reductase subunit C)
MNRFRRSRTPDKSASTELDQKILPPGTAAPAFALPDGDGQMHTLEMYRGQPVILVFYPGDWSPVCTDQLALYNEALPIFAEYRAQLLGISVDSRHSHRAFAEQRNFKFPLLADFEPKGAVARQYRAYDTEKGSNERALFVVDPQGIIRWSYLSPRNVNPGADGILHALEDLKGERTA